MKRLSQLAVPIGIVLIIVMLVVPLPAILLDLLIAANISFALLVLLTAMFVNKPLDFAAFPSVLLVLTLFRLALNVSATRLVLIDGYAGKVIDTFGHFVVGGSLIVGIIVFAILVIIQFVVITKGAERVAEVGARFTLDAMPGKQMAIDADLNSGLITDEEARQRRKDVAAEADFYGAMDGGSKFVKGDAIAAIIITLVNLLGGFAIGVAQKGLSFSEAIETYSLLSIGDGLVSQIPALLLSVATGLIVTRATSDADMGSDIVRQLGRQKLPLQVAGAASIMICLVIPALPKLPFILVGVGLLFAASRVKPEAEALSQTIDEAIEAELAALDTPESMIAAAQVDPIGVRLSPQIIDLVDHSSGGDLIDRVKALRKTILDATGFYMQQVRTRDDVTLGPNQYAIDVYGVEVARGIAPQGTVLAIGDGLAGLPGPLTNEPVFGTEAKWIPKDLRTQAEVSGMTVIDRSSLITTHLSEIVRKNAAQLLGREEVRMLVEIARKTHPTVVEELTPASLSLGEVQRVLQGLLAEGVPILNRVAIFEAISLKARETREPDALIEAARWGLGPAIAQGYLQDGALHVISFDPRLEQRMQESMRPSEAGMMIVLDLETNNHVIDQIQTLASGRYGTIVVCAPQLRQAVRRMLQLNGAAIPVLSYRELPENASIVSAGAVNPLLLAIE